MDEEPVDPIKMRTERIHKLIDMLYEEYRVRTSPVAERISDNGGVEEACKRIKEHLSNDDGLDRVKAIYWIAERRDVFDLLNELTANEKSQLLSQYPDLYTDPESVYDEEIEEPKDNNEYYSKGYYYDKLKREVTKKNAEQWSRLSIRAQVNTLIVAMRRLSK